MCGCTASNNRPDFPNAGYLLFPHQYRVSPLTQLRINQVKCATLRIQKEGAFLITTKNCPFYDTPAMPKSFREEVTHLQLLYSILFSKFRLWEHDFSTFCSSNKAISIVSPRLTMSKSTLKTSF